MAQKLLIRTPNHLGDCIMSLPMVNNAKEVYHGSSLTILVPEHLAEIYTHNPAIDDIIKIPGEYIHGLVAITKIKELLRDRTFDVAFILPPSFGAAAGLKLSGIKERIGYIADGRRLLLSKPLPLPSPLNSIHRSELYFNLLRRGAGADIEFNKPKLFLNDIDMTQATELLNNYDLPRTFDFVSVAFQAVAESRRWGVDNYIALVKRIISELNLKVALIGSAEDKKVGDEIAATCGAQEVKNFSGVTTIREAAAILSLGKAFVGNDSGPAHLAASVGVPVVVLSGADDPKSTSPIANDKVLIYNEHLPCISCVKNKCTLKGDDFMACMKEISVEQVFNAVQLIVS